MRTRSHFLGWCLGLLAAATAHAASDALLGACDAEASAQVLRADPAQVPAITYWLDGGRIAWPGVNGGGRYRLVHAAQGGLAVQPGERVRGADAALALTPSEAPWPAELAQRFKFIGQGVTLALRAADRGRVAHLLQGELRLVQEDAQGRVLRHAALQLPGALDDLYRAAEAVSDLGVTLSSGRTRFKLWAPTAQRVALCDYAQAEGRAAAVHPMQRDARTGVWSLQQRGDLAGRYYSYLVDVFVPGVGLVRNRVTDPYAVSLNADSRRSYVADLHAPALQPEGWAATPQPDRVQAATDLVIYELHVRDFSASDASVPPAHRGKYLAFTDTGSRGMQHLKALADAGLTDVHLLPVFDFATVPERGCVTPAISGAPDGTEQQAAVAAVKDRDCFNWGYDPFHYGAPEGSYASDANDGARRILEFRAMVQALHRAGLRVGMDVVYNHTSAAGQAASSVLDRIVPGYYQRLNAQGQVETSTCCANTATEHRMMGKLLLDTVQRWAVDYRIDSFRFDLMAHQPRALMERLQQRLRAATGRDIPLIGEGWNFGEVADGARFVQASQLSLNGSGIGTFSDRARDAVRGGGPGDSVAELPRRQGYINGLVYGRNAAAPDEGREALLRTADMVRVGLAGSLRDYPLTTARGETLPLQRIDYNGQPAGYASQPAEVVNYVENHDNQSLYDSNVLKLPRATSTAERARVQILGAAITAFSQGIAYFHAGIDTLRSKSMDRNSYDSGDWFNRLDWTYADNGFGAGLPLKSDNGEAWPLLQPLLADPALKPTPADIAWTRDAFRDLLRIRASSPLFRLRSAEEVRARLRLHNTGPAQEPTVLVGELDGSGYPRAGFARVVYLVNVDTAAHEITVPSLAGLKLHLHPVHTAPGAADTRPAGQSRFDAATGRFSVPPRTAVVYVLD